LRKFLRERRNQRRRARIENIPLPIIRNPVEMNNPIIASGNLPTGEGLRRSDDYYVLVIGKGFGALCMHVSGQYLPGHIE